MHIGPPGAPINLVAPIGGQQGDFIAAAEGLFAKTSKSINFYKEIE